uniref:NADH-ubiquinone oxidoreductase chain 2 n=1 Tax=Bryanellocoris orientalis TaxID=2813430 RepID=A0A8T9W0Q2_9HEMI|nr:NADH dehydrogenase subunit 2 [Bryanellocoris orientalis]UPI55312.1 NADH dehydrogenase subunit 2 [Bryanellocoris orientalis]
MNYSKIMFMTMVISSSILTINSTNWLSMWMGLEMNLMAFIPILSKFNNKKKSQSMMIYFLVQSIGSILLLFPILMNPLMSVSPTLIKESFILMMMMSLLLKLGAAPLHNWMPEMFNSMNWKEMFLLMTWQKLAPLYMLSNISPKMLPMFIYLSAMIGAIGGLNTTSLRKIMAYSSINHMSWMMMMMMMQAQWYKYLFLYSMLMIMACMFFHKYNFFMINQAPQKMTSMMEKYTYTMLMLSIGGLPPFMGFLPKWITIQSAINSDMMMMMMILIMMSMITLFYYMRIISPLLLSFSTTNKYKMGKNKLMLMMMMNLMAPLMLIISFI